MAAGEPPRLLSPGSEIETGVEIEAQPDAPRGEPGVCPQWCSPTLTPALALALALSPASKIGIGIEIESQPDAPRGEPGVRGSTCEPDEPEPALGTWPAPDPEPPLPRAPTPAAGAAHTGD